MKLRLIPIIIASISILVVYCAKTKIIGTPPLACITTDKDTILLKDTLLITNCSSTADNTYLNFYDGYSSASSFTFDKDKRFRKKFNNFGVNFIIVRVWNNQSGTPIMEKKKTIVVLP